MTAYRFAHWFGFGVVAVAASSFTRFGVAYHKPPLAPAFFGATVAARPTLAGVVLDTNGKPVGGANVYLYTAAPIKGTSPFCPSCYPDCQKYTVSDAHGRFRIPSLDPNLRFRVLVVADHFLPAFQPQIVPARGAVRFVLSPRLNASAMQSVFRGTITDEEGHPVVGARVEPNGTQVGEVGYFGNVSDVGVEPLAVTNTKGEFDLFCDSRSDRSVSLLISARGLASQTTSLLPVGSARHRFTMVAGATVRGLIKGLNGMPLRSVVIGITQVNKEVQTFVGHSDIGTDSDGQFSLTNITPNQDCVLYGTMDTFVSSKAPKGKKPVYLPLQTVHVGASGSVADLGSLPVLPARRLSGCVVLPNDKPVPPQTRLLVNRDAAWDSQLVLLQKNGDFEIVGLPAEMVYLNIAIPGYHISPSSKDYEPNRRAVRISAETGDTDGLQIIMEPNIKG